MGKIRIVLLFDEENEKQRQRTIRTVQKEIGIEAYRKQGTWYWHMPEPEEEVDEE